MRYSTRDYTQIFSSTWKISSRNAHNIPMLAWGRVQRWTRCTYTANTVQIVSDTRIPPTLHSADRCWWSTTHTDGETWQHQKVLLEMANPRTLWAFTIVPTCCSPSILSWKLLKCGAVDSSTHDAMIAPLPQLWCPRSIQGPPTVLQ